MRQPAVTSKESATPPDQAKYKCPSTNDQLVRYRRCAKNLILGISAICLRLNFPRALISTQFAYLWTDTSQRVIPVSSD